MSDNTDFRAGAPPRELASDPKTPIVTGGFWISNRVLFVAALAVALFIASGTFWFVHRAQQLEQQRINVMWQQHENQRLHNERMEEQRHREHEDKMLHDILKNR